MTKDQIFESLKGGLVVSCQALEHEPMYSENGGIMPKFAKAAQIAGAVGIRANSVRDIKEIKEEVDLPLIGIIKREYDGFEAYITPTMKEVDELVETNCEIIAVDFTTSTRPDFDSASDFVKAIKEKYPNQLIMADCASFEDCKKAQEVGCDFIGTTMNGYTNDTEITEGPNFKLAKRVVEQLNTPLIAEGRIHTPEQAKKMLDLGAFCVVVGGAITRPLEIAKRFIDGIK